MRIRMLIRLAPMVIVAALLVAGCAAVSSDAASSYVPSDEQQQGSCDGVPAPKSLQLLPQPATVTAAALCIDTQKYVDGQGMWGFRQVLPLPAARIPAFVAGLTLPDVHTGGACTAVLVTVPAFVVTLADGSRLRPGVPGDGCHPRMDALTAFGDPASIRPRSESRTTQVLGDVQTRTDCGDGAKSPAIWMSASGGSSGTGHAARLPSSGYVSICYYRATANQEGELTRAGSVPAEQLRVEWKALPNGTRSACPTNADPMTGPTVDWLMFLPTPKPPYRVGGSGSAPIALLELGGCHRLFGPATGLAGDVPAALAARFAALADQPVR